MVTGRDFFLFQVIICVGSLVISYQTQKRKDDTLCVQYCTIESSFYERIEIPPFHQNAGSARPQSHTGS